MLRALTLAKTFHKTNNIWAHCEHKSWVVVINTISSQHETMKYQGDQI